MRRLRNLLKYRLLPGSKKRRERRAKTLAAAMRNFLPVIIQELYRSPAIFDYLEKKMEDKPMSKSLETMQDEVYDLNIAKGWFTEGRTFGEGIALLHSEVSEALEAYRDHGTKHVTREDGKPVDIGSEFADVLIRLLDECHRQDVDLETEYERKMAYNRTRPVRHGGKLL